MRFLSWALLAFSLIISYRASSAPVSVADINASLNYGSCDQTSCVTKVCDVSKKSCVIYSCSYTSGCKRLRGIKLSDEDIRIAEARYRK